MSDAGDLRAHTVTRGRAFWLRVAFVLVAMVLVTACLPVTPPLSIRRDRDRTRVLLVGDSILAFAGPAVLSRFAPWSVTVDATPGARASDPDWPARVQRDMARRPAAIVVQLGTNDTGGANAGTFSSALDAIMGEVGTRVPVLWADVRQVTGVQPLAVLSIDLQLRAARLRWPNLRVLEYAAHFAGHPEWARVDDVHPSIAGRREYARWLRSRVAAALLRAEHTAGRRSSERTGSRGTPPRSDHDRT